MRKKPPGKQEMRDYREFVFRATGADTDTDPLTPISMHDNLAEELRRLKALTLLIGSSENGLDGHDLRSVALVLMDFHDRMRTVLDAAQIGLGADAMRIPQGGKDA